MFPCKAFLTEAYIGVKFQFLKLRQEDLCYVFLCFLLRSVRFNLFIIMTKCICTVNLLNEDTVSCKNVS